MRANTFISYPGLTSASCSGFQWFSKALTTSLCHAIITYKTCKVSSLQLNHRQHRIQSLTAVWLMRNCVKEIGSRRFFKPKAQRVCVSDCSVSFDSTATWKVAVIKLWRCLHSDLIQFQWLDTDVGSERAAAVNSLCFSPTKRSPEAVENSYRKPLQLQIIYQLNSN